MTTAVTPSTTPEVVVMIGCPGAGKTTVARDIFEQEGGYWRVDGDRWKTVAAMLREAGRRPGGAGHSVVFDSTGRTRERRAGFVAWARTQGLPVRFVWVSTPLEVAMARNRGAGEAGSSSRTLYIPVTLRRAGCGGGGRRWACVRELRRRRALLRRGWAGMSCSQECMVAVGTATTFGTVVCVGICVWCAICFRCCEFWLDRQPPVAVAIAAPNPVVVVAADVSVEVTSKQEDEDPV